MPKKPQSVAHNVIISPLAPEGGVAVPVAQWDLLMARIVACSEPPNYLPSLAWTCIGIAVSALIVAAPLPLSVEFKTAAGPNYSGIVTECCLVFGGIAALLIAGAAFYFSWLWRRNRLDVRSIVIDDMKTIRARFTVVSASSEPSA